MSFQAFSRKAVTAAAIVILHALALYALAVVPPSVNAVVASAPLAVHFVSETPSRPEWQPTPVAFVMPMPLTIEPEMPQIETPVEPAASDRAITARAQTAPATAPASVDRGVPVLVSTVEYVREPAPRYPPQSKRRREQGVVVLRVLIDEQGRANSIDVQSSSGYARLDHAAREAVSRAAFRPYMEGGAPRRAFVLIPIEFALNRTAV